MGCRGIRSLCRFREGVSWMRRVCVLYTVFGILGCGSPGDGDVGELED